MGSGSGFMAAHSKAGCSGHSPLTSNHSAGASSHSSSTSCSPQAAPGAGQNGSRRRSVAVQSPRNWPVAEQASKAGNVVVLCEACKVNDKMLCSVCLRNLAAPKTPKEDSRTRAMMMQAVPEPVSV